MSALENKLRAIYSISRLMAEPRRLSLINFLSHKTDKIQLVFENISNPQNIHACIRTAMNFGVNKIHIIQRYNNFMLNLNDFKNREFDEDISNGIVSVSRNYKIQKQNKSELNEFTKINKANSGTAKWMEVQCYSNFEELLQKLESKYSPVIVSTDLSKDSINILDMQKHFETFIPKINKEKELKSFEILQRLIFNHQLSSEDIKIFKSDFAFDQNKEKYLTTQNFLQKTLTSVDFLNKYDFCEEKKPKTCIIVFGNESRGISEYIRKKSDYKIIIPQYGHSDVSFNISVCCGMVLFNFLSNGFLPGSFLDHKAEDAVDVLLRSMVNSLNNNHKKVTDILRKENNIEDY